MRTVGSLLDEKGRAVHTAQPDMTVMESVRQMQEDGIGALVVCEEQRVVGILSERDIVRRLCVAGDATLQEPVSEVMTKPVHCVGEEDTLESCMTLMTDRRCRHLPVLDGHNLVGIVSIGDLVKAQISEQRFLIAQLETYIAGSGV